MYPVEPVRNIATLLRSVPVLTSFVRLSGTAAGCKLARRARFQWTAFNQRISPLAQCRNVNIDPVLPPVDGSRVVSEGRFLFLHQRVRKLLHVVGDEVMLIVAE